MSHPLNPTIPEDFLSAYFDAELSSDESKRAERLLATVPGARRELDEWARLSHLIRSLAQDHRR